jgi:glutamyl-tRNA reductase
MGERPSQTLSLLGLSHRTASGALRDGFARIESELAPALDELREAGCGEALLVATCDRCEILSAASDTEALRTAFLALLRRRGLADGLEGALYQRRGEDALRHLFRVASALDSVVLGEPHILGQLRAAHRAAAAAGLVGAALEPALQAAYIAAKRVRSETSIAERPVSMAAAALDFARELHGDLGACRGLLLGPSEMGELMTEHFQQAGLRHLSVCGAPPRAIPAARRFACNVVPMEDLLPALIDADVVIAAIGSGATLVGKELADTVLRKRRRRPVLFVDAAIPPDIDPAVNDVDGAFLYDLDDLERAVLAGQRDRQAAAGTAEAIIEAELRAFQTRQEAQEAAPAIVAMRRHVEALRDALLAEHPGLDAERATRLLVNRLLHQPSEVLRQAASEDESLPELERALRRLFGLGAGEREESER